MAFIRKIKKGNATYLAEVENVRVDGKVKQRHIRYVGKEVDGKKILSSSISNVKVDHVKIYGPLIVLNHIAKEIKLSECLGKYGNEILSLVFAHCIDYKSINHMKNWFKQTDLNMILQLEDLTERKLLSSLDSIEEQDINKLQCKIFENVKKKYSIDDNGIVYDVTNTYLYGSKCSLGKLGKDKRGVKGSPLIQIGLGVTKKDAIPVFHKVLPGNIHDSKMFADSLTEFKSLGIKRGLIIFDRGVTSKKNHRDLSSLKWKVLCGIPLQPDLKIILRNLIKTSDFLEYKNRVKLKKKTVFYVVTKNYSIDKTKGTIAFCFNEQLKKDIKESRFDEISEAQKLISDGQEIKEEISKYFDDNGKLLHKKLKQAEEFDGCSCIFTTTKISKEEMVKLYFEKDIVEKSFRSLKGIIKIQPVRHWLYNRVISHVFICYLAYLLLSLLKLKLKNINISPSESLNELSSLYKIYLHDGSNNFKLERVVSLTKKQEKIMRCIDKKLLQSCSV